MHKRMRYYGALMTSKLLPEGTIDYNRLSDLCMIVIAGFDMGGEGKYRYAVRKQQLSSGYERIIRLNEIVASIKTSDEIGVKYMNAYEERMHDV